MFGFTTFLGLGVANVVTLRVTRLLSALSRSIDYDYRSRQPFARERDLDIHGLSGSRSVIAQS